MERSSVNLPIRAMGNGMVAAGNMDMGRRFDLHLR